MGHDVFLSYPTKNKEAADAVCKALEDRAISVWMAPRDIVAGPPWPGQIIQAIDHARSVVLILSTAANQSEDVKREIQHAVDKDLKIVPFRIEDVTPKGDLAYSIGNIQWIDAFPPPIEPRYERLAEAVRQVASDLLPDPAPQPPPAPRPPSPDPAPLPPLRRSWYALAALVLGVGVVGLVWHFSRSTSTSGCFSRPQNQSASRINNEIVKKSKTSDMQFAWEDYLGKLNNANVTDVFMGPEDNMDIVVFRLDSKQGMVTLSPLINPGGTGQEQEFQAKVEIGNEHACGDLAFDPSYRNGSGWWGVDVSHGRKATLTIQDRIPEAISEKSSDTSAANPNPNVFNPKINYQVFYEKLKQEKLFDSITQAQIDTISAILNYWNDKYATYDVRALAYILATAYYETGRAMKPIEEFGHGAGLPWGKPDPDTEKIYYGRGLVGLTWRMNYKKMGDVLNLDLVNHPELALQLPVSVGVLIEGMMRGLFTGRSVPNYINSGSVDWINARKVVSGLDNADAIAGYAQRFFEALQAASISPT